MHVHKHIIRYTVNIIHLYVPSLKVDPRLFIHPIITRWSKFKGQSLWQELEVCLITFSIQGLFMSHSEILNTKNFITKVGPFPFHWRTRKLWNVVHTTFNECWHMCYLGKLLYLFFGVLLFSNWGETVPNSRNLWDKSVHNFDVLLFSNYGEKVQTCIERLCTQDIRV